MKIGIYSLKRCCKSKKYLVAFGKRPCCSIFLQLFILLGMLGLITMFTVMNYSAKAYAPLIVIYLLFAACFVRLCLAEPGIHPGILAKYNQLQDDCRVDG